MILVNEILALSGKDDIQRSWTISRLCRNDILTAFGLEPPSAPTERISTAQRADIVLPKGQDFDRTK